MSTRLSRGLTKMNNGTIGGQSRIATPHARRRRQATSTVPAPSEPVVPVAPPVCSLGTPELIYTYGGGDYYPQKVVDSGAGTLLVGFGDPSGAPTDGIIQELDIDGTDLGLFDSYTRAPLYIATSGTDVYAINDYEYEIRKNNVPWADVSLYTSEYFILGYGLAVSPNDGSVWFTDFSDGIYEVDPSGSTVTRYALGTTQAWVGLVWVTDRFYTVNNNGSSVYSYEPGVGFAAVGSTSPTDIMDVTYSPDMGLLYVCGPDDDAVWSLEPSTPGSITVVFQKSDFSNRTVFSVTAIGNYLYAVTSNASVWRVPIVCS